MTLFFFLEDGDLFIFSSKAIPGNEKVLSMIYNEIVDTGAELLTSGDHSHIHVSGHAGRKDLKQVYDLLNPDMIIPIHGETYFLKRHCEFIKKESSHSVTTLLRNNNTLSIDQNLEFESCGLDPQPEHQLIHGRRLVISRDEFRERRKMATLGRITIVASFKKAKVVELEFFGLPNILEKNKDKFNSLILFGINKGSKDINKAKEQIRIDVRRYAFELLGYKPLVKVILA